MRRPLTDRVRNFQSFRLVLILLELFVFGWLQSAYKWKKDEMGESWRRRHLALYPQVFTHYHGASDYLHDDQDIYFPCS